MHVEKIKQVTAVLKELTEEFQSITAEAKFIRELMLKDPHNKEIAKRMADNELRLEIGKKRQLEAAAELKSLTAIQ